MMHALSRGLLSGLLSCCCLLQTVGTAQTAGRDEMIDIGSRRELFIDHYLIETMSGVRLELNRPRNEGVVIRFDQPWEFPFAGCPAVIRDQDKYILIYRGMHGTGDGSDVECTCYAESQDGVTWTKPDLGLFEVKGTKHNNVIWAHDPPFSHNFTPFLDARPGVEQDQRFKAVSGTGKSGGLWAFASPDAIHWRKLQDGPAITQGAFDSQNVAFWSEAEGSYVCYFRTWIKEKRWVSRVTSADFIHWSSPAHMTFRHGDAAAPDEHIYTNGTHPYFRAPHIYIALPFRFWPGRRALSRRDARRIGVHPSYANDCSDAVLMTSRGGAVYDRTFLESFIRPGLGAENWVSRTNMPALNVVQTGDEEMSLYLECNYAQPTVHLQRFSLRLDGFASVRAPYEGGELLTRPLRFAGECLMINFATSAGGGVRVEIQDASGTPLPGYSLAEAVEQVGNAIERPVAWQRGGDVSALSGRPVRLRFALKDADLYALRFGPLPLTERLNEGLFTFDADSPEVEGIPAVTDTSERVLLQGGVRVVSDQALAAVGTGAVEFTGEGEGLATLDFPSTTRLGAAFTLAAFINVRDQGWTRLFSNYRGGGPPRAGELALSFDPSGRVAPGLVFTVKEQQIRSDPVPFVPGRYTHVAATYDDGAVVLYVDGAVVGQASVPAGDVALDWDLGFGEDLGGPANEQFRGYADDILILGRALDAGQVRALSERLSAD